MSVASARRIGFDLDRWHRIGMVGTWSAHCLPTLRHRRSPFLHSGSGSEKVRSLGVSELGASGLLMSYHYSLPLRTSGSSAGAETYGSSRDGEKGAPGAARRDGRGGSNRKRSVRRRGRRGRRGARGARGVRGARGGPSFLDAAGAAVAGEAAGISTRRGGGVWERAGVNAE